MKITGIIKDAFLFPSKNIGGFAIYLLLSVLMIGFALGGVLTYTFGLFDDVNYMLGGIYLIIAVLMGFIIAGFHVMVIKSGIELSEDISRFHIFENFMTGFGNIVISAIYYIVPGIFVAIVAYGTGLFDNAIALILEIVYQIVNVLIGEASADLALNAISTSLASFVSSLTVTVTVALVVFIISSVIVAMAMSRYAITGSLSNALNVCESVIDIARIGILKVIAVSVLVVLIISIILMALVYIFGNYLFLLFIILVIVTPYFSLVIQRAFGLLYSDIA